MATIWDSHWKNGKESEVELGWNYKKKARSLVVPTGQKVTIYENEDRKGKKSIVFYEGEYSSLAFYGIKKSGAIHVEKCDLRPQDLIQMNWHATYDGGKKKHRMVQKLPIGDHTMDNSDFPNDKAEELEIPLGVTVEAFEDGSYKGGSLIFSGKDEKKRTRIKLKDFGYQKRVSSMKITADDWEPAGLALTNPIQLATTDTVAGTLEIANNTDVDQPGQQKTIEGTKSEEIGEEWEIGGSATVKLEAEITTGMVATTVGGEVTVSGEYGESKTTTTETSISDTINIDVPAMTTLYGSIIVTYGKTQYTAERKWRNKVTGVIISEQGTLTVKKASNTRTEIH